jgi:hypothetical protein
MAALFDVPGPVDVHLQFKNEPAIFLGNAVVSPEYEIMPGFIPVMNDVSGRTYPYGQLYDGAMHRLSMVLNRVDTPLMRRFYDWPLHTGAVGTLGTDNKLARGSFITGVNDVRVVFANTFFNTPNATPNTPAGRMYFSAFLGNAKESAAGTRVTEWAVLIECHSLPTTDRGFRLFSENPNDFPALNPN